jgi:hypothetical protein
MSLTAILGPHAWPMFSAWLCTCRYEDAKRQLAEGHRSPRQPPCCHSRRVLSSAPACPCTCGPHLRLCRLLNSHQAPAYRANRSPTSIPCCHSPTTACVVGTSLHLHVCTCGPRLQVQGCEASAGRAPQVTQTASLLPLTAFDACLSRLRSYEPRWPTCCALHSWLS